MPGKPTSRLAPQQIEADIDTSLALKGISDYTPHNPRHSLASVSEALAQLRGLDEAVIQAHNAAAAARDAQQAGQHDFHALILGVKDEVRALFGPDSDQFAALGLKKKSERSKPRRPAKTSPAA